MNSEPPPLPPPPPRKPIALPLVLAFTPSAIALLLTSLNLPNSQLATACIPATIVSIACCAVSSIMIIKRNTTVTLVFGILLAMLNVVISLGLGCAALFADMSFR